MKLIQRTIVYLLCLVLILVPMSCISPVSIAEGMATITAIQQEVEGGTLTRAQADQMIAVVRESMDPSNTGVDWGQVIDILMGVAGATGLMEVRTRSLLKKARAGTEA